MAEEGNDDQGGNKSGEDNGSNKSGEDGLIDVVVDGEKSKVSQADLIAGYQQNGHFTQKSQGLADRERQMDKLIEDRATKLYQDALAKQNEEGNNSNREELSGEDKLRKDLDDLRSQMAQSQKSVQDKEADRRLDIVTSAMKEKYPKADMDKVMIRFYNEGNDHDKLEDQFDKFASESQDAQSKFRQSVIDEYVEGKKKEKFGSGEIGHSGGSGSNKQEKLPTTFEEARARADERLGLNQ